MEGFLRKGRWEWMEWGQLEGLGWETAHSEERVMCCATDTCLEWCERARCPSAVAQSRQPAGPLLIFPSAGLRMSLPVASPHLFPLLF